MTSAAASRRGDVAPGALPLLALFLTGVGAGSLLGHRFGTAGTLRLLVVLAAVFLVLAVISLRARATSGLAAAAILVVALRAAPDSPKLWARLHGAGIEDIVFAEDGSGLSLIKQDGKTSVVYVNGVGQSELPYGGFHTVLGALPVLIHPRPVAVALIGLGSGETLFGAAGRAETSELHSIEIVEPQLDTLVKLRGQRSYAGLNLTLDDGRIRHAFTDGRAFILKGGRKYDVIEADALRPTSAYSGNLYSHEYFDLLRRHLKPGGLAVTWEPSLRTRATVLSAFPHVLSFRALLVASDSPIAWDPAVVRARMQDTFTNAFYRRGHVDIEAIMTDVLSQTPVVYGPSDDRSTTDINLDLFPRDEYLVGESFRPGRFAGGQ